MESSRLCVWKILTCRDVFFSLSPWLRVNNTWCHTRCANKQRWSLIGAMRVWRALIEIGGKGSQNRSLYCADYYCVWTLFFASKCSKIYAVGRMRGNLAFETIKEKERIFTGFRLGGNVCGYYAGLSTLQTSIFWVNCKVIMPDKVKEKESTQNLLVS